MRVQLSSQGGSHTISVTINDKDYSFVINEAEGSYTQAPAPAPAPAPVLKKKRSPYVRFLDRMEQIGNCIKPDRSYTLREISTLLSTDHKTVQNFMFRYPSIFSLTGMRKNRNLYRISQNYVQG